MSWRKTYTGYSIGCAVVWAVILSVVAVVYREPGQRERHQYLLTEKGHDLFAALVVLMQWGDRWEAGPQGGPVVVRHRECGEPLHVELRCRAQASRVRGRRNRIRAQARPDSSIEQLTAMAPARIGYFLAHATTIDGNPCGTA